jgi:hypothetical protein
LCEDKKKKQAASYKKDLQGTRGELQEIITTVEIFFNNNCLQTLQPFTDMILLNKSSLTEAVPPLVACILQLLISCGLLINAVTSFYKRKQWL